MNPYLFEGPALISFSGGRTSGYLLKQIINAHRGTLPANIVVVFANTGKERSESLDFVNEVSERWGVEIVWLEYSPDAPQRTAIVSYKTASRNGEPFEALLRAKQMLPNPVMRFCTIELKIRRFREYAVHHLGWQHWQSVVGLRHDEQHRVKKQLKRNAAGKDLWRTIMPLDLARATKQTVSDFWREQNFDLRLENVRGRTPEGNCDLCFLKAKATIMGLLRRRPQSGCWWAKQEVEAVARGTMRAPEMALFRADRPSYSAMLDVIDRQGDFDLDEGEEDDGDCACTD
jgi:3'-phosphoadenosine 5'-phosphosulfate sulfotransferase (PAPS reductase)/FAD synthetase